MRPDDTENKMKSLPQSKKTEMADGGEGSQELTVESGVAGLGV